MLWALALDAVAGQSAETIRRSQPVMGTFVTVTLHGSNHALLEQAATAAFEEFHDVDLRMSLHRPDSELNYVNATASHQPVPISTDLFGVIAASLEIAQRTDGAFDITTAPLSQVWGFTWKNGRWPSKAQVRTALASVDYRWIQLDPTNHSIRFLKPGVKIDLGGIAKGYAVDRAIARLRSLGISNAMVKAGGDLRVIGTPPDGESWEIWLEDPRKQGLRDPIQLRKGALSTSGNYENFFMRHGRRYGHILDPHSGWPVHGIADCTVTAPTSMEADAMATACYVLGSQKSLSRFGKRLGIRFRFTENISFRCSAASDRSALFPKSSRHN